MIFQGTAAVLIGIGSGSWLVGIGVLLALLWLEIRT